MERFRKFSVVSGRFCVFSFTILQVHSASCLHLESSQLPLDYHSFFFLMMQKGNNLLIPHGHFSFMCIRTIILATWFCSWSTGWDLLPLELQAQIHAPFCKLLSQINPSAYNLPSSTYFIIATKKQEKNTWHK